MTKNIYQYNNNCRVIRLDYPSGKKTFLPQHRKGNRWIDGAPDKPWALFQKESLEHDGVLFIVEGEKCALVMKKLGLLAMTSMCGSNSAKYSDWSSLADRDVVIIPDNDGAGAKYADDVAEAIRSNNPDASVRVLLLPKLKETQDVIDFIERCRKRKFTDNQIKRRLLKLTKQAELHIPAHSNDGEREEGRNNELTRVAGTLRHKGHNESMILTELRRENKKRFPDNPLPEDEIRNIAKSVCRYEVGNVTKSQITPEFQAFPTHALPEAIGTYVNEAANAIGCDPSYIITPLLACLGAAIGPTRRIELKGGWTEFPVIWSLIIGKSGTQKSPALKTAVRFLRDVESKKNRDFKAALADFEEQYKEWEKALKRWKKEGENGSEPTEPVKPHLKRHICSDVTVEALARLLGDHKRGLLLFRDEMSGWFGSFGRYSGAGAADVSSWLELFRCEEITIDRKTGDYPEIRVERPFLCMSGSIQPGALRHALKEQHLENGLASRLLFACPPPGERKWNDRSASQDSIDDVACVFRRLLSLKGSGDGLDGYAPKDIKLSDNARQLWIAFFNEHQLQGGALGEAEAAAWSKLEAYAPRIALIFNLIKFTSKKKGVNSELIDEQSMRNAIEITRWYCMEALRIYAMLRESKDDSARRNLIDAIRRHGGSITANDLRVASRRFSTNKEAKDFLQSLVTLGQGKWKKLSTTKKGGRPTNVFVLKITPTTTETNGFPEPKKEVTGNSRREAPFAELWEIALERNRYAGFLLNGAHRDSA